jgi:C1A family cysteine protease
MAPIRSQGNRGTCTAFASIAAFEHNVRKHPPPFGFLLDLSDCSEQWLYYRCKKGAVSKGIFVAPAYKSLLNDGTVPELDWPYQPVQTAIEDGGPPLAILPEPILLNVIGTQTKIKEDQSLDGKSVADFRNAINSERAVTFWVPVYDSWFKNPWASILGLITMPVPNETSSGAHSMCIVGYIDQPEFPEIGGGRFIVRNSWGEQWGLLNPWSDRIVLPRGYGTIPYAYITKFGQEARIIKRGPFE